MDEHDWEKFEKLLSQHDPNWKKKVATDVVIRTVIEDMERKAIQEKSEREHQKFIAREIEGRKQRERAQLEQWASEEALDHMSFKAALQEELAELERREKELATPPPLTLKNQLEESLRDTLAELGLDEPKMKID